MEKYIDALVRAVKAGKITIEQVPLFYRAKVQEKLGV